MELTAEMKAVRDEILAALSEFKTAAQKDIDALKAAASGAAGVETKEALANLKAHVDQLRAELQAPMRNAGAGTGEEKTIGQLFIEHPRVVEFSKTRSKSTIPVEVAIDALQSAINRQLQRKTTITSAAVGAQTPGILQYQRLEGIIGPPMRRLRVRDLIPFSPTEMTGVDFVKENVFTNAASPQVEALDKAESALTFVIDSANARTIAHWIPAARQVLEDLARLRAYIDTRLMDGLADKEDEELLRGDGTGQHVSGICTKATAYAGTYDAASDTRIDKLNHAIAELEDAEYAPDGLVLHPADWRIIQLIKTEDGGTNKGSYILGGPAASPRRVLWDLPAVCTTAMTKGKFLVGQFAGSVEGFDRQRAVIDVSTEHSDFFIKNLVAIRAEERVALAVGRPGAFRYGSF